MNILTIPKELQLHIIGLLRVPDRLRLSETCHALKDLVRDPSLWKQLVLCYKRIRDNTEACRDQVSRCSKLRDLSICSCDLSICSCILPWNNAENYEGRIRSDKIMNVVMKAKSSIKTLTVRKFRLSNSSFKQLSQLTQLTHLNINARNIRSDGIAGLAKLLELRSLKLYNFRHGHFNLSNNLKSLEDVFSILKKLEVVEMRDYDQLSDEAIENLVVNNQNLHHLDINSTSAWYGIPKLTSKTLSIIADNCPQITHIDIGHLTVFTNDDLIKFTSKCSKLIYANFEDTRIEDSALERLASDCPNLEHLKLSNCLLITEQGTEAFLNKAAKAQLKSLDIRDCHFLRDDKNGSISDRFEAAHPHIDVVDYDDWGYSPIV